MRVLMAFEVELRRAGQASPVQVLNRGAGRRGWRRKTALQVTPLQGRWRRDEDLAERAFFVGDVKSLTLLKTALSKDGEIFWNAECQEAVA